MSDIFDLIGSTQTMDFSDNYQTSYNFFEQFFPSQRSTAEYIKVLDYDVDYNPTALAVPDNVISPLAEFPEVESEIMDFVTFKLEYQLSDGQIRKLLNASSEAEIQEAIGIIFNMEERLLNAHYIARERIRAQALAGKVEINENGFHPAPWDYGLQADNKADIDLLNDDIVKKGLAYNRKLSKLTGKRPARLVLNNDHVTKLSMNETFRKGVLGTDEGADRFLTEAEVIGALRNYLGWEIIKVQDGNNNDYFWTDITRKQHLFMPDNQLILLPNIRLGATVVGNTAEELVLGQQEGITLKNDNGITVLSNYEPRPVKYTLTSVSRFNVVYPKAPTSLVLTDTSDSVDSLLTP